MAQGVIGIAYPRAALMGNPSDGLGGMTIAFVFSNYHAEVRLEEREYIEFVPGQAEHLAWKDLMTFQESISNMGYYGGLRLLKATLYVFSKYCPESKLKLTVKGFRLSYSSSIPRLLGLSGSSAIISACLRALGNWYSVKMEPPLVADLVWRVETEELGIPAGLQDRMAQAFNHPMFMDFDQNHFNADSFAHYEKLKRPLNNLYIAYSPDLAQGSRKTHEELHGRFMAGDTEVLEAVEAWKRLTLEFRDALNLGDAQRMNDNINANFDLRNKLCSLNPKQIDLIKLARRSGASAKCCGSGEAIIGMYANETMFERLRSDLGKKNVNILRPTVVYSS